MSRRFPLSRITAGPVVVLVVAAALFWLTGCRPGAAPETAAPTQPPFPTIRPAETHPPVANSNKQAPYYVLTDSLTWDPTGRWLAYAGSDGQVWLRWAVANEPVRVSGLDIAGPAGLQLAWAPDGSSLLVWGGWGMAYPRQTGVWQVKLSEEGTPTSTRALLPPQPARSPVMQNSGEVYSAAWSADSRQVAFTFAAEAWVADLEGGVARQVTHLAEKPLERPEGGSPAFTGVRKVSWSPDGKLLALQLTCECPSPWNGVAVIDPAGGEPRLLVDGATLAGWSPESSQVVVQNSTGDWTSEYTYDFYAVDPQSGELTNLTESTPGYDPLKMGSEGFKPAAYQTAGLRWGPEGARVYEARAYNPAPATGFVVRRGTEAEEHLGSQEAWYLFPMLLEDGRLAYLEAEPRMAVEGSNIYSVRTLVVGDMRRSWAGGNVTGAVWSPDGRAVALITAPPGAPLAGTVVVARLED